MVEKIGDSTDQAPFTTDVTLSHAVAAAPAIPDHAALNAPTAVPATVETRPMSGANATFTAPRSARTAPDAICCNPSHALPQSPLNTAANTRMIPATAVTRPLNTSTTPDTAVRSVLRSCDPMNLPMVPATVAIARPAVVNAGATGANAPLMDSPNPDTAPLICPNRFATASPSSTRAGPMVSPMYRPIPDNTGSITPHAAAITPLTALNAPVTTLRNVSDCFHRATRPRPRTTTAAAAAANGFSMSARDMMSCAIAARFVHNSTSCVAIAAPFMTAVYVPHATADDANNGTMTLSAPDMSPSEFPSASAAT